MCLPGCAAAVGRALDRRGFFTGAAGAFAATAIAPATASAAPRRFTRVIDLTHTMSAEFPSYFGVPGIEMQRQTEFKKDGYNSYWWRIFEHAGTHLDAPLHFTESGTSADALPADALVVPLAVIDVAFKAEQNADYLLAREDIANWEKRHGRLPDRCCLAMHSGWARHAANSGKFTGRDVSGVYHFPGVSPQAAEWLIKERSVVGLAVDTLSLDNGPSKDFKTHYLWLPSGRWGLENVANLDKVPAANATLVIGAPKVKDATGGLSRVMALV
jgi:kynurenine formamidase